jgi:GNAT superfamily N-acetyltransferase
VSGVSELLIRPLDPRNDADMDAFQEVYAAAELAEDADAALYSRADGISILGATDGGRRASGFGAFDDGVMVGELMVSMSLTDNLDTADVWIWVTPSHQRRGIGTRLGEHAHELVGAAGRHVCQAQGRIGADRDNGNARFARSLGYTLANTEIERRLPLPADLERLDALAAQAAPYHRDYDVRTVVGPVPDELADSYVALKNLLSVEAPMGELDVEAGQETVAELAAQERQLVASGRTRVGAYAVTSTGEVVAYSVAAVSNDSHRHVDQWGTLVHPTHRGHRLGMAVKCAGLRAVTEGFPHKRFVETTNAETNTHMVAINVAVGFEVAQVYGAFQRRL